MRRLFARFIISAVYLFSGHVATRLLRPSLPLRAGRVADRSGVSEVTSERAGQNEEAADNSKQRGTESTFPRRTLSTRNPSRSYREVNRRAK